MGIFRIIAVVLVAAAVSAGLTGWIMNVRQVNARLKNSYYPVPPSPIVPLGDTAGAAKPPAGIKMSNPLSGDASSVTEGRKLFLSMNCASCHGYDAKGGMGPNLTDTYWRYGGTPERIYELILDGRPQGMPEWGVALPRRSIWQLVSYIQSLGGSVSASKAQAAASGNLPTPGNQQDRGQNKGASDQE